MPKLLQLRNCRSIEVSSFGLIDNRSVPVHTEPAYVFQDHFCMALTDAIRIKILHPKQQLAASASNAPPRKQECAGVAQVKLACGAGCQASDWIAHKARLPVHSPRLPNQPWCDSDCQGMDN